MVAQFQSLLSPFIVLFTIPLAFTGGLLGLLLTGQQLTMISLMGFIVLMGTVVNNGIVFVDYANQLRIGGMERRAALILSLIHISNQGNYISIIVSSILSSMLIGAALAIIVLAIFLKDIKPTLVVGIKMCIRDRANRLEPKRLAFVKNRLDAAPWLFLVEAQKNRKTGLRVEPDVLISAGAALYGR